MVWDIYNSQRNEDREFGRLTPPKPLLYRIYPNRNGLGHLQLANERKIGSLGS